VHRVRTTSDTTSVSINLLANDTGCVWRHTYDEHTGEARPFRSGYVNAQCINADPMALGTGEPTWPSVLDHRWRQLGVTPEAFACVWAASAASAV
jgi:hypothetical protein